MHQSAMRWPLALGSSLLCGCLLLEDPPVLVDDQPTDGWVDLAVHSDGLCALQSDGALWCGPPGELRLQPGLFTDLSGGGGYNGGRCAVREDGTLECTADGGEGFELTQSYTQVSGDASAGCGLLEGGSVRCWPENPTGRGPFSSIGAGDRFACGVLMETRRLSCWRINNVVFDEALTQVPSAAYLQVATADHVGCAIASSSGSIDCWGDEYGSLIELPPAGAFARLSLLSDDGACALTTSASTKCWGDDATDPSSPFYRILDPPAGVSFVAIDLSSAMGCGIDTNSILHCW